MTDILNIVTDYLRQKDTDYAIMISGNWGCGKTYFLEHDFSTIVRSIDSGLPYQTKHKIDKIFQKHQQKTTTLKYEPIIISLYGISSAEDFYNRVFLGLHTWAKQKWVGIASAAISKVVEFFGTSINKSDANQLLFIDAHHVLVFDDLERICVDKISFKEVLGLINSYVEQDKRKVFIVCNEEEVQDNKTITNDEYKSYKEKTIRFTCAYHLNIEDVLDSLISQRTNQEYIQFLTSSKNLILTLFKLGGKENIRTLKFILDVFEKLCSLPIEDYKETIRNNLLVSTMIYAMEYKDSISVDDLKRLKEQLMISLDSTAQWLNRHIPAQQEQQKKTSYTELTAAKYGTLYTNNMYYLPEIVDYLSVGSLDEESIEARLQEIVSEYKKAEIKPEIQLYRKLSSFVAVDDATLRDDIDTMISYVKDGIYSIYDIMHVYALLLKYHHFHIEGFVLSKEIDDIFANSLTAKAGDHVYHPSFEVSIPMWDPSVKDTEEYQKYNALKEIAIDINKSAYKNNATNDANDFMKAAEEGNVEILQAYRNKDSVLDLTASMDWNRITSIIENSKNPIACEFIMSLEYILHNDYHANFVDLSLLKQWIESYLSNENNNHIRKMYILELKNIIQQIR